MSNGLHIPKKWWSSSHGSLESFTMGWNLFLKSLPTITIRTSIWWKGGSSTLPSPWKRLQATQTERCHPKEAPEDPQTFKRWSTKTLPPKRVTWKHEFHPKKDTNSQNCQQIWIFIRKPLKAVMTTANTPAIYQHNHGINLTMEDSLKFPNGDLLVDPGGELLKFGFLPKHWKTSGFREGLIV